MALASQVASQVASQLAGGATTQGSNLNTEGVGFEPPRAIQITFGPRQNKIEGCICRGSESVRACNGRKTGKEEQCDQGYSEPAS